MTIPSVDEPPSTTQLLDTDITTRLYLDRNEVIRLRVERDEFYDNEPGPRKAEPGQEERVEDEGDRKAPYTITVSENLLLVEEILKRVSGSGICEWGWIGRPCVVGEYGARDGDGCRIANLFVLVGVFMGCKRALLPLVAPLCPDDHVWLLD